MSSKTKNWINGLIALLLIACFLFLGYLVPRENFSLLFTLYTLISLLVVGLFVANKGSQKWLWIFALGFVIRLSLFVAQPQWSDDYPRFLWDGQLLQSGVNPYSETPSEFLTNHSEEASPYLLDLYHSMNSPNYYSVYPPMDQAVFWLSSSLANENTSKGIMMLRIFIILSEIGVFFLLLKLLEIKTIALSTISLYWLNPLIVMELTGNLHFEGLVLFFVLAALIFLTKDKLGWSGAFWGFSIGLKLLPLIFLPAFLAYSKTRKSTSFWIGASIAIVFSFCCLLIDSSWVNFFTSLKLYQGKFEFNASIYYLLREVGFWIEGYNTIATLSKILSATTLILIAYVTWKNKPKSILQVVDLFILAYLIYLLLQPIIHPWYLIPGIGLSIISQRKAFLLWSFAVIFSYQAYDNSVFQEQPIFLFLEYIPLALAIYWDYFRAKTTITTSI